MAAVPKKAPFVLIHYYDCIITDTPSSFKRWAITLYNDNNENIYDKQTIHYTGCNESLKKLPDGNRMQDLHKEYVRTASSVLAEKKTMLHEQPIEVYKKPFVAFHPI